MNKDEILAVKLSSRCCRKKQQNLPNIKAIVDECSADLGMKPPELICCESLTRSFSAFYLMGQPYIIYDACLIEALYIYDSILVCGANRSDMDKFFYKLFGEECIRNGDLVHALYFAGKHKNIEYSFDRRGETDAQIIKQVSYQSYFLLGHELCHIKLNEPNSEGIPEAYKQFVRGAIGALTEREMKKSNQCLAEYVSNRTRYFPVTKTPQTLDEYLEILVKSERFIHFAEECYCDFIGFKLLVEQYRLPNISVNAISSTLNYLITQECIRSDLCEGIEFANNTFREANATMFYSVLRVQILLLTLEMNRMKDIEQAFAEIHDRSQLTDRLRLFIQGLPNVEAMKSITEDNLPDIDRSLLVRALLQEFYYCSVSP